MKERFLKDSKSSFFAMYTHNTFNCIIVCYNINLMFSGELGLNFYFMFDFEFSLLK